MTDRLILRHRHLDKHCFQRPTGDYYTLSYGPKGGCTYVFVTRWDIARFRDDVANWDAVDDDWRLPV